jgi:hypothetical protein
MMSDDFDALTADLFDADFRPLDTEQSIHLYGAVLNLTAQLGAWDVEDEMLATDPEFAAVRQMPRDEMTRRMGDGYQATVQLADLLGEVSRRYAVKLSTWVAAHGLGPVYMYVALQCCGTLATMVLGDGKPARFFDSELGDEMPVRGGRELGN